MKFTFVKNVKNKCHFHARQKRNWDEMLGDRQTSWLPPLILLVKHLDKQASISNFSTFFCLRVVQKIISNGCCLSVFRTRVIIGIYAMPNPFSCYPAGFKCVWIWQSQNMAMAITMDQNDNGKGRKKFAKYWSLE